MIGRGGRGVPSTGGGPLKVELLIRECSERGEGAKGRVEVGMAIGRAGRRVPLYDMVNTRHLR